MNITAEAVVEYLKTEEGQKILQEMTAPLASNKNKILEEKREINARLDALAKDHERLTLELDQERKRSEGLIIDKKMVEAFDKIKITNPAFRQSLKALWTSTGVEVQGEKVMKDGIPVEDWAVNWSALPEAQAFIDTPISTGAGSHRFATTPGRQNYGGMSANQIIDTLRN